MNHLYTFFNSTVEITIPSINIDEHNTTKRINKRSGISGHFLKQFVFKYIPINTPIKHIIAIVVNGSAYIIPY